MTNPSSTVIKSHSNPTIRRLVKLRDNRYRRKTKHLLVDGWRETSHAIRSGMELHGLYLAADQYQILSHTEHRLEQQIVQHAQSIDRLTLITQPLADKIAFGQSPRGVVAEFIEPESNLESIKISSCPFLLILDRIEKPGNLGAIFRTGDAAGVDAVLLCECTDRFNPNAIRNSQGTIFHVPSACGSLAEIDAFLKKHSVTAHAARVESSDQLWDVDLKQPTAIILGNEAEGLGSRWQQSYSGPIRGIHIPMQGEADSLNVSVTAAIISMEAARQRSLLR